MYTNHFLHDFLGSQLGVRIENNNINICGWLTLSLCICTTHIVQNHGLVANLFWFGISVKVGEYIRLLYGIIQNY